MTRPDGDGEPRGLSPRHLESPAARPPRPPHVNGVQAHEPSFRSGRPRDFGPNPGVGQAVWERAQFGAQEMKVAAVGIVLAVLAAVIAGTVLLTRTDKATRPEIALELPAQLARPDPLHFEPGRTQEYEQAAAFGLSHVLFEKSPGGVLRAAQRTARFRDIVDSAVSGSGIDPDIVEAIVLLESAGRQDVIAGDDPENAAGLTQILAETATNFLGMQVDLEASRRLTRLMDAGGPSRRRGRSCSISLRATRRGRALRSGAGARRHRALPDRSEEGLRHATTSPSSRTTWASAISPTSCARTPGANEDPIDSVVRDADIDYARLYFDSSPIVHRAAWEQLASFGDDSQTYYWRVLGALGIMHLFRNDPGRLERLAGLHDHLPSAELVLHPPAQPRALRRRRTARGCRRAWRARSWYGPATVRTSRSIRSSRESRRL